MMIRIGDLLATLAGAALAIVMAIAVRQIYIDLEVRAFRREMQEAGV